MADRQAIERRAALLVRGLEERGRTAAARGAEVAVLLGAPGASAVRSLSRRLPALRLRTGDGSLLLDIRSISEDDIARVAEVVAAELLSVEGTRA